MMDLMSREILAFPDNENSTGTLFGGVHWNLTTLRYWSYSYFSNGTISNGSRCFLVFEPYTPVGFLPNGSFINGSSCYSPIKPLADRSIVGLVFGVLFATSIMVTFVNLRKHGRQLLPSQKRFRAVGRRWQWYWMLAAGAFGLISSIVDIDVDRYYLPGLPLALAGFFWYLMLSSIMAAVWESVRH